MSRERNRFRQSSTPRIHSNDNIWTQNFSIILICVHLLHFLFVCLLIFWRGTFPHSSRLTFCQLKDPNRKRVPLSLAASMQIPVSWQIGLTRVTCSTRMPQLAWLEGWGQAHQNLRGYKRIDTLKEDEDIPTRILNAGKAKCTDMHCVERVAVLTTFIPPHVPTCPKPGLRWLYRFILVSFPSVIFYNKIFEQLIEQVWEPAPYPHPHCQPTTGDLLLILSVCPAIA